MAEAKSSVVDSFLEQIDLQKYCKSFHSQRYETAIDLYLIEDSDLDSLGIDPNDRVKLLAAAADLDIKLWLCDLHLERYIDEFRKQGVNTIKDLIARPTDDLLRETLNIKVPVHRKRISRAAQFLKWHSSQELEGNEVAIGYWGQPPEMRECKHPFLIVPGYLKSSKGDGALSTELIQFTVDSGSEVCVTVTQNYIRELNLKYIQNIESRGVHAAADKPIYEGVLKLGDKEITVEVMPDRFCTVGSAVMRKFKHDINRTRHRWLKDDEHGKL